MDRLVVSTGRITDFYVSRGNIGRALFEEGERTTVRVSESSKTLYLEGFDVYLLDTEGSAASDLERIVGGADGQVIYLMGYTDERRVTIKDNTDPDQENAVVCHDDFVLFGGNAIRLRYLETLDRWLETGRLWPTETYPTVEVDVDKAPTPPHEESVTLLAEGVSITF